MAEKTKYFCGMLDLRRDLLTQEEFIPTRINQKFANPYNRIRYYNNKANKLRHEIAYVNKPLHNNLKILNEIMRGYTTKTFHKEFLLGKGFDFAVHTHVDENTDGSNDFAVYNYTIIRKNNIYIKVIKNG